MCNRFLFIVSSKFCIRGHEAYVAVIVEFKLCFFFDSSLCVLASLCKVDFAILFQNQIKSAAPHCNSTAVCTRNDLAEQS